nr:transposase [Streptomyces virginiae]
MKNVPGRKTDLADSEWICKMVEHGLVRPSFVPPPEIRQLRDLTRYRTEVIRECTREAQRLEKLLEDAGIKLSSVVCDLLGKSARAMLEALIAGVGDPLVLAETAKASMRAKRGILAQALTGRSPTTTPSSPAPCSTASTRSPRRGPSQPGDSPASSLPFAARSSC